MNTVESKKNIQSVLNDLATSNRYPHATIFYGPNLDEIFNIMIEFCNTLHQSNTAIELSENDEITEPEINKLIIHPPGNSIKIAIIHQLQQRIKYGSDSSKTCVVIIHNIERLTNTAANALLKTIEDPPENIIFLLSCNNKENILSTIQSRSQAYFIPQSLDSRLETSNQMIEKISATINYLPPDEFLSLNQFEQCKFIHELPKESAIIQDLLHCWAQSLSKDYKHRSKKEQKFLEKIIEIISNFKYNFNLKLQLLAVTFKTEED